MSDYSLDVNNANYASTEVLSEIYLLLLIVTYDYKLVISWDSFVTWDYKLVVKLLTELLTF